MDLRALCYGEKPAGARRLLALINGIPVDSALRRKRMGENAALWDMKTELAAATVDLLQVLVRQNIENPPDFEPVPRPFDEEKPQKEAASLDSLPDFLKGI